MVDHINNGESGLIVRGKLNEVIDRTNTLNGIEDKVETNKQNIAKNATEIDELWAHVDDVEDTIQDLDVSVLNDKIDQEVIDRTEGDASLQDQIDTLEESISDGGGFIEAPNDGKLYGRQSEDWAEVVIPEPGESYDDTQIKADLATETQARIDGDAALQGQIDGLDLGGAIDEAPVDGKQYARQDASWSEIVLPEGDAPSLLYGSWSYNSSSAPTGSFTTRNANWFTATTLTLHKNDTSGYEHSFELMTEGDVIVVQAPSGGAEYRVISKTMYADFCDFVVDTISAFGSFPSNGYSVDFNFVPQIASGAGMVISAAEPVDPVEGMQWLNSNTAEVFIFDGAVWLEFPAGSSGSGGGLWEADGDDIYYDKGNVGISGNLSTGQIDAESGTKLRTVGSGAYEIDIAGGLNLSSGRDNGADMTFEVSNSEMMRINASGNVGIGETNPTKNIDVRDATNASMVLKVTGASQFSFINDGTTADIGVTNQKDLTFSTGSNGDAERMRIDSSGKVGIGTDAPTANLFIKGDGSHDSTQGLRIQGSSAANIHSIYGDLNDLVFETALSEAMRIGAAGDVTIATDGQGTTTSRSLKWGGNGFQRADITVTNVSTYGADMHFSTGNNANYNKRMTIGADGNTTFTGNVSAPNITSRGQIIQDGAPVVDSLQIIRAFMKLRDAVDDPDSSVEQLREKLKVAVVDIIDQFQEQIDNMDDIDTPVVMPAEDSE